MTNMPTFTVKMTEQMTNAELAEAIQQAFCLRQRTHETDPMYERVTDHLSALMIVQRSRAAACLVDDAAKSFSHMKGVGQMKSEMKTGKSLPRPLCRWWLKSRPCKLGTQLNAWQGIPPCIEFYVPIWAWPFELLHWAIFGRPKLNTAVSRAEPAAGEA